MCDHYAEPTPETAPQRGLFSAEFRAAMTGAASGTFESSGGFQVDAGDHDRPPEMALPNRNTR
jgi:hypothetical protein